MTEINDFIDALFAEARSRDWTNGRSNMLKAKVLIFRFLSKKSANRELRRCGVLIWP